VPEQAVLGYPKPSRKRLQASPANPQSLNTMPLGMLTDSAAWMRLVHAALLGDRALDPGLAILEKARLSRATGGAGFRAKRLEMVLELDRVEIVVSHRLTNHIYKR